MGRLLCTLTILLIFSVLLVGVPYHDQAVGLSTIKDEEIHHSLKIVEICPAFGSEFVRLRNSGHSPLNLSGWSLSDGEGELVLGSICLNENDSVYICSDREVLKEIVDEVYPLVIGVEVEVRSGRFILADQGDEVILRSPDGELEDVFVYGKSQYSGPGWTGLPFPKIARGESSIRIGEIDTNTSMDWRDHVPGRSSFSPMTLPCWVEPFVWPDNAFQMLTREIEYATKSVLLCLYSIDHSQILEILCGKAMEGLSVRMLLEGQPVSGLSENNREALSMLIGSGVDVVLAKSNDGYKRYDYFHCKYAVMDGHRSVVMSENWLQNSFSENRGWGVVVESGELGAYLTSLFEEDSNESRLDISLPAESPKRVEFSEAYHFNDFHAPAGFNGLITPIISPDFSLEVFKGLIQNASHRIYVQQFYCDQFGREQLLPDLIKAAERGVEIRILLDSSWFNSGEGGNADVVEMVSKNTANGGDIQARLVSNFHNFSLLHNKGIIIDETVVISSINWCQNAFLKNREVGLAIESPGLARYFISFFESDWLTDPFPPTAILLPPSSMIEGEPAWFDASRSSDNAGISRFRWFLDSEELDGENGSVICASLSAGRHRVGVLVIDIYGNTALNETFFDVLPQEKNTIIWLCLPLASSFSIGVLWLLRKKIKWR
jgi:cardiolipin synthase A/B